jgi:hypothetical protein
VNCVYSGPTTLTEFFFYSTKIVMWIIDYLFTISTFHLFFNLISWRIKCCFHSLSIASYIMFYVTITTYHVFSYLHTRIFCLTSRTDSYFHYSISGSHFEYITTIDGKGAEFFEPLNFNLPFRKRVLTEYSSV